MIQLKRAYQRPSKNDGTRILVERLWPRGLTREKAKIDVWLKEAAPSAALRQWFNHDVRKWPDFRKRYKAELKKNLVIVKSLKERANEGKVTFIFAARDEIHNSAVVLKDVVESFLN